MYVVLLFKYTMSLSSSSSSNSSSSNSSSSGCCCCCCYLHVVWMCSNLFKYMLLNYYVPSLGLGHQDDFGQILSLKSDHLD